MAAMRPGHAALAACVVVLCASRHPAARQVSQAAERGADLLPITFAAVGADGRPVADLAAADVSLKIDGRTRAIRSLQLVGMPAAGTADAAALPAPFGSNNVSSAGRTIALIVDDESFTAGGEIPIRQAIDRLLSGLQAPDRVSLATIPHGGIRVAPTTDRGRLRTAAATLTGRGRSMQTGSELACRTRETLRALDLQLQGLPQGEAPAIVVFLTAGLAPPRRDAAVTMAPGMCELLLDAFRDVGTAAGRSRAHFYVVPPVEIMITGTVQRENIAGAGATGSDNPIEGIEHLLGTTGGKLLNLGSPGQTALDRIAAENASYYVAAIEPQRGDRGRAHALEIRVARTGAEVRSSRSITFAESDARSGKPAAPSPREMLSTLAEFRDLPLRAAAYPSFDDGAGQIRVLTLAEPGEPNVTLTALAAALFDRDGKPAGGFVAQPADLAGPAVIGAMNAPPGAYRLRVAAIDSSGRSGAVDYDVDVALAQTGSLKISALLLGLSRSGGFTPRLQFTTEPVVLGYVEMAGAATGAKVTATLELADSPNGPARLTTPLTIQAGEGGRYVGKGALPIGALPPGDYTVRALIALDDHAATRVLRTLRKAQQ